MLIPQLSGRQQAAFWTLLAVVAALITWGVLGFVTPAPPRTLTLSTGAADGAYHQFGLRYRELLRANGVDLKLQPSTGSVQNMERLNNGSVEAAFVQGGLGFLSLNPDEEAAGDSTPLRALATVAFEPVWIFSRNIDLSEGLGALAGKRIVVGVAGSGNRKVAGELLTVYGVIGADGKPVGNTQLVEEGGIAGARKLMAGEVDAMFLIAAPQGAAVQLLLSQDGLMLASLRHAQGLARKFPYLQTVTLQRGAVDPKRDVPSRNVTLLATTANLVVTKDVHPALNSLLLQAAQKVHRVPTLVNSGGEFPSANGVDFPLDDEADRYFRNGRPFFQRYLPFWAANYVQRLLIVLLPLVAVLVPLMRILPPLLAWRQKHKLFRRYGELKFIERDIASHTMDEAERATARERLDDIERDVSSAKFPLDLADRVYTLRQHVDYVRSQLERQLDRQQDSKAGTTKTQGDTA